MLSCPSASVCRNYGDFLMTGGPGCNVNASLHCPRQTDDEYRTVRWVVTLCSFCQAGKMDTCVLVVPQSAFSPLFSTLYSLCLTLPTFLSNWGLLPLPLPLLVW